MAETETSQALSQEVKKQDYGIYNQGRVKLNFDEQTQDWKEQYEPVKGYKMFIPPAPKKVKLPTDVTVPTTPVVEQPTAQVTQPATPIVEQRDKGESFAERQQREMMERFGPGQDPMQMAKTMSSIFTPGTEQYGYYDSMGALKLTDGTLTVNFDAISEKGGYGLPSLLGAGFKYAEKDIIEGTLNKLKYAGILTGSDITEAKGMYTFNVDQDKMNSYRENASTVSNLLSGGYRDASGNYIRRNDNLLGELSKLDRADADAFIADMAIAMGDDNSKNTITNALKSGTKGAAAALIAFQTGEDLDLDRKGLFGPYYNQQFKDDYNRTMTELNKNVGKVEEPKGKATTPDIMTEEKKQLLDDIDELLKKREEERGGDTAPPPAPTTTPKPPSTPGASGPPGRNYPTGTSGTPKAGTGSSGPPGRNYSSGSSSKSSSSGGSSKSSSSSSGSGTRSGLVSSNKNKSTTSKAPTGTNRPGF